MAFVDNTTGGRIIAEGVRPVKLTLAGTVKVGDLIGYATGWKAADMNSSPKVYPEFVAGGPGVSGDVITAYREAVIDLGSGCTATAGDKVYASTDAGQYVGAASNDQAFCVGFMTTAQIMVVNPVNNIPAWKVGNYSMTASSGTLIQLQLKPNLATTGTASVTGIEIAPKVLDAVAANQVRGVYVGVDLEGASAGTVTDVEAFEANVGSDSGTARTATTVRCFRAVNNMHGTVTNGPFVLDVDAAGGNVAWGAFVRLQAEAGLAGTTAASPLTDIQSVASQGWIKVLVGSTVRYIPLYATTG